MSSEFAEFLFSFACNKLETSPQLDLRQQLLHSNLIRHILLVHQPATTSESTTATLPQSPSSSSSRTPYGSPWNPFSFDDELDRIELADQQQQDSDVDMEEQDETDQQSSSSSSLVNSDHSFGLPSSSAMIFDDSYYNLFYQSNSFQHQDIQHQHHLHQMHLHQMHHMQLQYPLQQHQQQMLDEDQEYQYEASQAQEDWLDAVLEDLIEDDQDDDDDDKDDDDDVSSPEYDNDDDSDSDSEEYHRHTFEDDVERRQRLSDPLASPSPPIRSR
ncbi:hypothetical protein BGX33_009442 [Mortierella sp. NVP41]|nr:hypothetical protein BGX33_009442 [Mortierella sp. NVP41]